MKLQKWLAALLCVVLLAGLGSIGGLAAGPERPDDFSYMLNNIGDAALKGLLKGVTVMIPPAGIPRNMPANENFLPGMGQFKQLPASPSYTWKLGYAKASLTEGLSDSFIKKLDVTGAVSPFGTRKVSEILDPPTAYATALSDGKNGVVVFVSLDAFGITSVDVGHIRAALKDFAKDKNIISINVSALHQHSVIDTLGMNGNALGGLFLNSFGMLTSLYPPISGKNRDYMKHLTKIVSATVKEAVDGMESGTLHYGKVDVSQYINEKRKPDCFDPYFHRLRFKPAKAGSRETWLTNAAIHTTGLGTSDTKVSGDWPYFIAKNLEQAGKNFQFINGAEFAIGIKFDGTRPTSYERMEEYGDILAGKLKSIKKETQLPALLNIAHKEYVLPVDNPLHLLFFRLGIIESAGRRKNLTGTELELRTEVGYMELGGKIAVAIVPGEIEPALAFDGKGLAKEQSYRREEFTYKPMKDYTGGLPLLVFGLTNDQIGYIPLPNDVAHFVAFGNEEVNTASTQSAPLTLKAFGELTENVR